MADQHRHTPDLASKTPRQIAVGQKARTVEREDELDRLRREVRQLRSALRTLVGAASAVPDCLLVGAEDDPPGGVVQSSIRGDSLRD